MDVVTVYRGSNSEGIYGRAECPRGTASVSGGAGKQSGTGYFNILMKRGHRYREDGRVGWIQPIDVGAGPLEIHVNASRVRQ